MICANLGSDAYILPATSFINNITSNYHHYKYPYPTGSTNPALWTNPTDPRLLLHMYPSGRNAQMITNLLITLSSLLLIQKKIGMERNKKERKCEEKGENDVQNKLKHKPIDDSYYLHRPQYVPRSDNEFYPNHYRYIRSSAREERRRRRMGRIKAK